MDPTATLEQMREISSQALNRIGELDEDDAMNMLTELSQLFESLDNWIINEGTLPHDWIIKRRTVKK
jgi:hypothetical protein